MRRHKRVWAPGAAALWAAARPVVLGYLYLVGLAPGCTPGGTPRGMSDVATTEAVTPTLVGQAAAAQTGAPAPSAPAGPIAAGGGQAAPDRGAAVAAAEVYAQRCVLCHGTGGRGDGVAAENLRPRPRNLREAGWQKSASDEAIAAIIVKGGAQVGKSMMMPANPDLQDKPKVTEALVQIIRSFGG